jgi:predicted transcriptional regulator
MNLIEVPKGRKIMKYRASTEIIDTMLRSIKSGATKTHIMYQAYLSYGQLKEYLKLLQEKKLIKYEESSRLFKITERGVRFINAYDKISELVPNTKERDSLLGGGNTTALLSSKKIETFNY